MIMKRKIEFVPGALFAAELAAGVELGAAELAERERDLPQVLSIDSRSKAGR